MSTFIDWKDAQYVFRWRNQNHLVVDNIDVVFAHINSGDMHDGWRYAKVRHRGYWTRRITQR